MRREKKPARETGRPYWIRITSKGYAYGAALDAGLIPENEEDRPPDCGEKFERFWEEFSAKGIEPLENRIRQLEDENAELKKDCLRWQLTAPIIIGALSLLAIIAGIVLALLR